MSLTLQVPVESRMESNRASGPLRLHEDDEDSSILADLTAMFPSLDHDVIVTVLQAHEGRIQAAVEYLMTTSEQAMSGASLPLLSTEHMVLGSYNPAQDMVGQFSEDIGGLPEVLPAILCEGDVTPPSPDPSSEENRSEGGESADSPVPPQPGDVDNEPLPTYEEACMEPSSQHPLIAGVELHWEEPEMQAAEPHSPVEAVAEPTSADKKKKKGKISKMVSKLTPKKKGVAKYKAVQEKVVKEGSSPVHHPQQTQYQRLIDYDELQDE